MRVLLTGGTGLLGRQVLATLIGRGDSVFAIGRTRASAAGLQSLDLRDPGCPAHFPQDIECVVHLAALLPIPLLEITPGEWLEHNALATLRLLEWSARQGIRSFVYASTWSVYGHPARKGPLRETDAAEPADLYAASKYAGELYCAPFAYSHGLATSILRFSYIYGPGMRADTVVMRFLRAAMKGSHLKLINRGRDITDLVHVEDAARAVVAACDRPCGLCNVAGGVPVTIRALAEAAVAAVGAPGVSVDELPGTGSRHMYLDIERAGRILGWRPQQALVSGLRRLAEHQP